MRGRLSLWSNAKVKKLSKSFVLVADAVWRLQNRKEPDCLFFRSFCDEGHYSGSHSTRQGIYMFTPGGQLLTSINTTNAPPLLRKMNEALQLWRGLSPKQRRGAPLAGAADVQRTERSYPKDGLVLEVLVSDVARRRHPRKTPDGKRARVSAGAPAPRHWKGIGGNRDHAWFTKQERDQLLPTVRRSGQSVAWPRHLAARFVAAHLLDTVRGQTTAFRPGQVKTAELTTTIESIKKGVATLRITGESHCASDAHGVKTRLYGRASLSTKTGRFTRFDVLCLGTRWGATRFNFRGGDRTTDDRKPSSIAFFVRLAGKEPGARVAPSHHGSYGQFKPR